MIAALFVVLSCIFLRILHSFGSIPASRTHASAQSAAIVVGLSVSTLQALAVVYRVDVEWQQPLRALLEVFAAVAIDVDKIGVRCLLGESPEVGLFLMRLAAVPVTLAVVLGVYLCRHQWKTSVAWTTYCSTGSQLMLLVFVPYTLACLEPLQCTSHPNGRSTMLMDFSVVCFDGGSHTVMWIVGLIALLAVPCAFLAGVTLVAVQHGEFLRRHGATFVAATRGVFQRFQPSSHMACVYYIGRTFCLSVTCVVFTDTKVFQLVFLCLLLLIWMVYQIRQLPWRFPIANVLDGLASAVLVLTLAAVASLRSQQDQQQVNDHAHAVVLLMLSGVAAFVILVLAVKMSHTLYKRDKFLFFLTHHKAGAAVLARQMKLMLAHLTGRRIFLDVDELDNLDRIFFIVRSDVGNLLILLTRHTLRRFWCAGEIVTAWEGDVSMSIVRCDDSDALQEAQSQVVEEWWDPGQQSDMAVYGISVRMIAEAYRSLAGRVMRDARPTIPLADQQEAMRFVALGASPNNKLMPRFHYVAADKPAVLLVADAEDAEAVTTARILLLCALENEMVIDLWVPGCNTADCTVAMVVMSEGIFRCLSAAAALVQLVPSVSVVTVQYADMSYPDPAWFDGVAQGLHLDIERIPGPSPPKFDYTDLADAFRQCCRVLALRISPGVGTTVFGAELRAMLARVRLVLERGPEGKSSSWATRVAIPRKAPGRVRGSPSPTRHSAGELPVGMFGVTPESGLDSPRARR